MNVIKSLFITCLVLANLASTLMVPLIYLDFEVRNDYISKVLCIERDKPITVCGGSCYLTDKLNHAKEQQENSEKLTPREIVYFFNESKVTGQLENNWKTDIQRTYLLTDDQLSDQLYTIDFFHPPQLG